MSIAAEKKPIDLAKDFMAHHPQPPFTTAQLEIINMMIQRAIAQALEEYSRDYVNEAWDDEPLSNAEIASL